MNYWLNVTIDLTISFPLHYDKMDRFHSFDQFGQLNVKDLQTSHQQGMPLPDNSYLTHGLVHRYE